MRVLQVNSVYKYGSTGGIVADIANVLNKNGHECFVAYGQGTSDYINSYKIGGKLENHLHNIGSRLCGTQGYFTKDGTRKFIEYIDYIKPDVIHLHNIHGNYLNFQMLFSYLSESAYPIVWTLHDCWSFTGKCAYYTSANCFKWISGCHSCPLIDTYPPSLFLDRTIKMYADKMKSFNSIKNMTLVPVSKWLASEVSQSFLGKYPVNQIYNWIDMDIFHPYSEDVRKKYGFDNKKPIVVSVSAGWNKNTSRYRDAVKLGQSLGAKVQLVLVGSTARGTSIPKNIIHIPYVSSAPELAKIYSIADVYVHLSIQDTFGKVIAEAMACGTPVVVFNSTACPEVVGSSDCGYIVEPHDISAMKDCILKIIDYGKQTFSKNCIEMVKDHYDYESNINKFINLYQITRNI